MIAYNSNQLENLLINKEAKRWHKEGITTEEQHVKIKQAYPVVLYHPNILIRLLLFIATVVALTGITGLLALVVADEFNDALSFLMILYGLASWIVLEFQFIRNNHYKSGVTEAILYHSILWIVIGSAVASDLEENVVILVCSLLFAISSIRYADVVSTITSFTCLLWLIFQGLERLGDQAIQFAPFVFLLLFTPLYFTFRRLRKIEGTWLWEDCLLVLESLCLIIIYASGNYFVVREFSESILRLDPEPGQDIPLAFVFYILTVLIPIMYLYFGIRSKNVVLLRVSLLALAFSVFTFKYYFSLGHPEVTLTLAGAILLATAYFLQRFLSKPRHGYTREKLLTEKWAESNVEAFVISQTLGGNQTTEIGEEGAGGSFGGGGASSRY